MIISIKRMSFVSSHFLGFTTSVCPLITSHGCRFCSADTEAAREALAKGEQKASIHLKDSALFLEESTSALQLTYLQVKIGNSVKIIFNCAFQTLNAISREQSFTIVFPFPIDTLCLSMDSDKDKKTAD